MPTTLTDLHSLLRPSPSPASPLPTAPAPADSPLSPSPSPVQAFLSASPDAPDAEADALAWQAARELTGIDSPDGSRFNANAPGQPLAPGQYRATVRQILEKGLTALDTPDLAAWKAIPRDDRAARLTAARAARSGLANFASDTAAAVADSLTHTLDINDAADPKAELGRRTAANTQRDDELIAAHEADLLSKNWLHQYKILEPELSPRAREIVHAAAQAGTGIQPQHLEAFRALGAANPEESRRVAHLARAAMPEQAAAFWSDTAAGVADLTARMFGNLGALGARAGETLNDIGTVTRAVGFEPIDPAVKLDIDRAHRLLRDTNARKPYTGYNAIEEALMGAATTLPYMGVAMLPVVGTAAVALDQFETVRDRVIAEGGDPDQALLAQAAAALAYAYVEKISALTAFGAPLTTLGRRQLFMNLSRGGYGLAARQITAEVAFSAIGQTFEEMGQKGIEEFSVAHTLQDPDGLKKTIEGFISEASTLGTMALIGATGTAAKSLSSRSNRLDRESAADFAARQLQARQILEPRPAPGGLTLPLTDKQRQAHLADTLAAARRAWLTPPTLAAAHRALTDLGYTPAEAATLGDYLDAERALAAPRTSRPRYLAETTLDPLALAAAIPGATVELLPTPAPPSTLPTAPAPADSPITSSPSPITPAATAAAEPPATITRKRTLPNGRRVTQEVPNPAHAAWLLSQSTPAPSPQQPNSLPPSPSQPITSNPLPITSSPLPITSAATAATYRVTFPVATPAGPATRSYIIEPDTAAPDTTTAEFAASVQQATSGTVRAADYLAMTPEQQLETRRQHGLVHRGSFRLLDEAGRLAAHTDGLMRLVTLATQGPGTQAATNLTLYHEHAHAALQLAEQTGALTPEHAALLRQLYGDPAAPGETYNQEAVAEAFAEWLADPATQPEARTVFQALRDFIDRILRALGLLPSAEAQTRLDTAREAVFTALLSGDLSGLSPYAGITFTVPASPAPASAASQAPASSPSTPAPPSQPITSNPSPITPPTTPDPVEAARAAAAPLPTAPADSPSTSPSPAPLRATVAQIAADMRTVLDRLSRLESPSQLPTAPATATSPSPSSSLPTRAPSPIGPLLLVTPTGNITFQAEWMWIDRPDLIDSEDRRYPQAFQPRDRNRLASATQIHTLSRPGTFNPLRLTDSVESDGGSPIVAGGAIVLSGNGRKAILDTLARERRLQAEYTGPVTQWAAERGIPPPPAGMSEPILVRRITSIDSADTDTLRKIAELSNRPKILQRSEAELAEADARLLTPSMLRLYAPGAGGNLMAVSNAPFMQAFARAAGAEGDLDAKGRPTAALASRVQQAMLAAVIGTDTAARELIRTLIERDPRLALGTLYNDLTDHAGEILDTGLTTPTLDLTGHLRGAVRSYIGWRSADPTPDLETHLSQPDAFEPPPPPEVQALMRLTAAGRLGRVLAHQYALLARKQGANTAALPGVVTDRTPLQLLSLADRDTLAQNETPSTPDPSAQPTTSNPLPITSNPLPITSFFGPNVRPIGARPAPEAIPLRPPIASEAIPPAPAPASAASQAPAPAPAPQPSGEAAMLAAIDAKTTPPPDRHDATPDVQAADFFDKERYFRESPPLPASTAPAFRANKGRGNPDGNKVKALLAYTLNGNKGDILAASSDFFTSLAKRATAVYDCFCGGALYTHTLAHLGALPKGSRLNEFEYTRWVVNAQIQQNPEAVISSLTALRDRFNLKMKPGDRPDRETALADRQKCIDWINAELNAKNEGSPAYIESTTPDADGRLPLRNTPETAALYLWVQNHATQSRAKDVGLIEGSPAWMQDGVPAGKDDFLFIDTDNSWNIANRVREKTAPQIIREASARLQGVNITLGDGWQVALEAPAGALVFIDSSYFGATNYGSGTQADGDEATWISKIEKLTQRKDVTYVITNNWRNSAVDKLERLGFTVARTTRAGTEAELVAVSGNAEHLIAPAIRTVDASGSRYRQDQVHTRGVASPYDSTMVRPSAAAQGQDAALQGRPAQQSDGPGQTSLLDPRHSVTATNPQTSTPAFRRWFGASKVVGPDGQPLVVYHGTTRDFNRFKLDDHSHGVAAAYFSDSPGAAESYPALATQEAQLDSDDPDATVPANIMPVYLSLQNPYIHDEAANPTDFRQFKALVQQARDAGHDGFIARNVIDDQGLRFGPDGVDLDPDMEEGDDGLPANIYIAFNPAQIKSATGNRGTFSPKSPDIRHSVTAKANRNLDAFLAGSTVRDTVYHATNADFIDFDPSAVSDPSEGGFFFTTDEQQASEYGRRMVAAHISLRNPYSMTYAEWLRSSDPSPEQARAAGHDGFEITGFDNTAATAYVVFSPDQIRPSSPSTATATATADSLSPSPRHQLTRSSAYTANPAAYTEAYIASRLMAGKTVTPAEAAQILTSVGVKADPAQLLAAAQARAAAASATALAQAKTRSADLIERMASDIDREGFYSEINRTFASGANYASTGTAAGMALERARETALRRDVETAGGYQTREMQTELGIDLSAAVLATPDVQLTAEEIDARQLQRDRDRAQAEADALGTDTPEAPAPVPPSPTMTALLDQILADARARADADALEDQRRALLRAQNEKQDAADASADPDPDPSSPDSQPITSSPSPITYSLLTPAITNPAEFAAFLYEWATRRIRADRPDLDPATLYRHPAALRDLQRTAQNILGDLARDLLGTGPARVQAMKDIAGLTDAKTPRAVMRDISYIYSRIHASALRTSREDLTDALERDIKRLAVEPGRFIPQREDLRRRVTAAVEVHARTLISYMRLSPTEIAAEDARLTKILTEAEAEEQATGRKAEAHAQKAADQLAVLRVYGGMISWMPGQIAEAADAIRAQLTGDRAAFEAARIERQERTAQILGALTGGIMRGPADLQPVPNALAQFADANIGNLELRLRHAIRHSTGKLHADAEAAIQDLMVLIGEGETELALLLDEGRAAASQALKDCYGSAKRGMARLDSPIPPEAQAALSRQGVPLTYGQALQLYAQILQRDYARNVRHNNRARDLDTLRSILDSRDLRLHQTLVRWYADALPRLSAAQQAVTGLPMLSTDILYTPARMYRDPKDFPATVRAWSPIPHTLTPRVKNTRDFDESRDLLGVFTESLEKNARFLAFGARGIALRDILGTAAFQGTLERFGGKSARADLVAQVTDILAGVPSGDDKALAAANAARRWTALLFLAGNLSSFVKQVASLPAFAHAVGFRRTLRYLTHIDPAAARELAASPGFRARYGTGWNDATVEILSDHNRSLPAKALALGLTPIALVDKFVSVWFGQGYYRDLRAGFIDRGMSPADASARALTLVSNVVEQTQQSGRLSNLTAFQRRGGPAARLLMQFVTSPFQQMQFELEAIREYRAGTPGSRARLTRALIINHLLIPALLHAIASGFNALLGKPPPEDDERWRDLLVESILGQYGALFLIGAFSEDSLITLAGGKPKWGGGGAVPATAIGGIINQAAKTALTAARAYGPEALTPADLATVTTADLLADLDKLGRKTLPPYRHIRQAIENRQEP